MNKMKEIKKIPVDRRYVLLELITELKETECLEELKNLHGEGVDASELLECFVEGVRRVGLRFEHGEYFISALIMAGEIMRQCSEYLKPYLQGQVTESNIIGHVLLGTIEGDIHDLGKNIFKHLLECNGFKVVDLGVNVSARSFYDSALKLNPDFVAISCLLTTSLDPLQKAVKLLKKKRASKKYTIIIGGMAVDQVVNDHIQADHWFSDAIQGAAFCRKFIESGQKNK